jgi:hypothetical protein
MGESIEAIKSRLSCTPINQSIKVGERPYTVWELCEAIKREVLDYYGGEEQLVLSRSRRREYVLPRQVMHYLACSLSGLTLKQVGSYFTTGKALDHTTVIHSCNVVTNLMYTDPIFRRQVFYIYDRLQGIPSETPELYPRREKQPYVKPLPKVRDRFMSESEKVVQKYL